MLLSFFFFGYLISSLAAEVDYAAKQLETYAENHCNETCGMTTSYGRPITEKMAKTALNCDLLRHPLLTDITQHLLRERLPVRTVHSKGTGAFGYLEITDDISQYCRASIFSEVGKKTPLVIRISLTLSERGGPDTTREPRGIAIKFYTKEGNLDITCINAPMYAYKDPLVFTTFNHVIRRNPATGLRDWNMIFDFITLRPESMFFFMYLFSDRGIPDGHRHLAAFNIHTMHVVNKEGESYFMRFHFLPDQGIKNLNNTEAAALCGEDPDYAIRDLYNAIARGNFPSWTLYAQILSLEQVKAASFDVFDVTNILPEKDYPLQRIGKMVLNENPINQHAQIEQLAFNPGQFVDGFVGGPGKLFELRDYTYRDSHNYRLGPNFNNMHINRPLQEANTYNRDAAGPVRDNGKDAPNYYPNSFGGCGPVNDSLPTPDLYNIYERLEPENFGQARDYYENDLDDDERSRMIDNMLSVLTVTAESVQVKIVKLLEKIHPELSERVAAGLQDDDNDDDDDDDDAAAASDDDDAADVTATAADDDATAADDDDAAAAAAADDDDDDDAAAASDDDDK